MTRAYGWALSWPVRKIYYNAMVVAFPVAWLAALAVLRFGHIEQMWAPAPPRKDTPS